MAVRPTLHVAAAALLLLSCGPLAADPIADFYRGKTITCYIGYGAGGGYDTIARTISRYMTRHIPGNPTILPMNMPGASSMVLANFLAKRAPRDGTAFGAVDSALIFEPLFYGAESKAQFSGPDMTMIGNAVTSASVLFAWHTTGIKSIADLRQKELIIGATARTGDTYILPMALKKVLGLDTIKIILGYPGTREAVLALERGELSGRVWSMEGIQSTKPEWLKDGSINLLAQLAPRKMPTVPPDVPLAKDFAGSEEDKEALDVIFTSTILARPYIAPPEMPAERVEALRNAYMDTMKDPDFLAETGKLQLTISPTSGKEMENLVRGVYSLPDSVIQKVRGVLAD